MENLLKNLRDHLSAMIEEIDAYTHYEDQDIIIKSKEFKHLRHRGKLNSYVNVFEYKDGIKFTLRVSQSYGYDYKIYQGLMDGSLDMLILNKRTEDHETDGHIINYTLEPYVDTKLRNLYRPFEDIDSEDNQNGES
jgi:hypothetical protein